MTILLTAVVSIISYTHILPILDRLTEYIQALILTQKMRVNVEYMSKLLVIWVQIHQLKLLVFK